MAKRTDDTPADDFDDLLADDTLPATADADAPDNFEDLIADESEPELTADQKRIKELEAALAAQDEAEAEAAELTEDQKRILELEAMLAERQSAPASDLQYAPATAGGETVIFHFREDGLILFGNVWLRGQEVEVVVGSPQYKDIEHIIAILDDEDAQNEKWGRRMVSRGTFKPRKGERFDDEVARADLRRNRRIPISTR